MTTSVNPAAARQVFIVGRTEFIPVPEIDWHTDASGGQALAEFAGRSCYESWDKPKPETATNAGFIEHILDVGHLAVLEHASVSFYIRGVSRALSHELVRHRNLSFSQLSPRQADTGFVEPDLIAAAPGLHAKFSDAIAAAQEAYAELLDALAAEPKLSRVQRKQAREMARSVLPHASATAMVVTGNYRAWRHFIAMRATEGADVEMRALAIDILRLMQESAPHVFADFRVTTLPDGTAVAASPLVGEG